MEHIAQLAAELPRQVTSFYAGDELYAGKWLTDFQRVQGAWEVCIEALRPGPLPDCDGELLQEFCAQTLGRLARSFGSRFSSAAQVGQLNALSELIHTHAPPRGRRLVWKQLALALTCAGLWTGKWSPPTRGAGELPAIVRRELFGLPVDLLFCDRALPLDEGALRQAAAGALLDACDDAFGELLQGEEISGGGDMSVSLHPLAAWLGALRKALHLLPTRDVSAPLQALARHGGRLQALVRARPTEAAEIALQLARWHQVGCGAALDEMLGPLLGCIFGSVDAEDCGGLLPLLSELAAGCWPRAVLGDSSLNWRAIAEGACVVFRVAATACRQRALAGGEEEDADGALADAEAALGVWQTFAMTVREGSRCSDPFADDGPLGPSGAEGARPEKRSRLREQARWRPEPERVALCEALPELFAGFARILLEALQLPEYPIDVEAVRAICDLRAAAEEALAAWGKLVGSSQAWQEASYSPLQACCIRFATPPPNGELWTDDELRDAEVAVWAAAALARCQAEIPQGAALPAAAALVELQSMMDEAMEPWQTWLWAAGAALAATAPAEHCQGMIEWMLPRAPWKTFAPELLEITELPFSEGLERLCRLLPAGQPHIALGEQLVMLAFAERPQMGVHADTVKAQSLLLQAVRHSMGSETQLLCAGLAQRVLPALRAAVDQEAEEAPSDADPAWRSAQVLFATLAAALPPAEAPTADLSHPSVALWREHWPYAQAALLRWPIAASTEQPAQAASAALHGAATALPGLLPEILPLLASSVAHHEAPVVQLQSLKAIAADIRCPPCDAAQVAELMAATLQTALEPLLARQVAVAQTPPLLAAMFELLAESVRPSPAGTMGGGACGDQLRLKMLARSALLGRCATFVPVALLGSTSVPATTAILRFMADLVGEDGEQLAKQSPERVVLCTLLPELAASLCQALASIEHLADMEGGLTAAADFLLRASAALPDEFPQALAAGMRCQAQLSTSSSERLQAHIAARAQYPKMGDWLRELQDLVCEFQRESRRVSH